jgi:hypothetical protein
VVDLLVRLCSPGGASEIAEAEYREEAGVPVAGLVIRARKNGANDKSFAPSTYLRSDTKAVAVGFV